MTVTTTANSITYAGNGVTKAFAFPYIFFEPTDLVVTLINVPTDTAVTPAPVLNGAGTYGYTVTGVITDAEYASGATVTFNNAPITNYTVSIVRAVPATQEVDLVDNAKFPADTVNTEFDKLTVLIQDLEHALGILDGDLGDLTQEFEDFRDSILEIIAQLSPLTADVYATTYGLMEGGDVFQPQRNVAAINEAIRLGGQRRVKTIISGGSYPIYGEIKTVDNLDLEFATGAVLRPVGPSTTGSIIINLSQTSGHAATIQDNITISGLNMDFSSYPVSPQFTAQGGSIGDTTSTLIMNAADDGTAFALDGVSGFTTIAERLAGSTFTGVSAGSTTMTVTLLSGYISLWASILTVDSPALPGDSVPVVTVFIQQLSGTTGGSGTYLTNNVTTVAGHALKTVRPVTLKLNQGTGVGAGTFSIVGFTGGAGGTLTVAGRFPAVPDTSTVYQWGYNDNAIGFTGGASNVRIERTQVTNLPGDMFASAGSKGINFEQGNYDIQVHDLTVKGVFAKPCVAAVYCAGRSLVSVDGAKRRSSLVQITKVNAENCAAVIQVGGTDTSDVANAAGVTVSGTTMTVPVLANATFTATSVAPTIPATAKFDATAVTGVIQLGSLLTGPGIPAETLIIRQESGAAGAAGRYVASANLNISGSAATADTRSGFLGEGQMIQMTAPIADPPLPSLIATNTMIVRQITSTEPAGALGGAGTYEIDTAHTIATPIGIGAFENPGDPDQLSVVVDDVTFHNCGHAPFRMMGTDWQKSGPIVLFRAQNTIISNVVGYNDPGYPGTSPGYLTDWFNRAGVLRGTAPVPPLHGPNPAGHLAGSPIGAVIWGHGRNVILDNIEYHGDADTYFRPNRARAQGEDSFVFGPVDMFDVKGINLKHAGGTLGSIIEPDQTLSSRIADKNQRIELQVELAADSYVGTHSLVEGPPGTFTNTFTPTALVKDIVGYVNTHLDLYEGRTGTRIIGTAADIIINGNLFSFAVQGRPTWLSGGLWKGSKLTLGDENSGGTIAKVGGPMPLTTSTLALRVDAHLRGTASAGTLVGTFLNSDPGAYTVDVAAGVRASLDTLGLGSIVTANAGLYADDTNIRATSNFGVFLNLPNTTDSNSDLPATIQSFTVTGSAPNNVVTITTTAPHPFSTGQTVTVAPNTVAAGFFVVGGSYFITVVGTTDFTLVGAADNLLNTRFTATGAGTGSGSATPAIGGSGCVVTGAAASTFTYVRNTPNTTGHTIGGAITPVRTWNVAIAGDARSYSMSPWSFGAANPPTAWIDVTSSAAFSPLRIRHGAAPTTPQDGDMWTTGAGAFIRINGVTKTFTLT